MYVRSCDVVYSQSASGQHQSAASVCHFYSRMMAMDDFTIIPYIAEGGSAGRRELELQYSAVRAHSARVAHQKRRKAFPKPVRAGVFKSVSDKAKSQLRPGRRSRRKSDLDLATTSSVQDGTTIYAALPSQEHLDLENLDVSHGEVLEAALKSLSLAKIAHETGSDAKLAEANENHQIALRHIRLALEAPVTALKDQTLAAIRLIAHFDLVAGRDPEEVSISLTRHYDGALALLEMRSLNHIKSDFRNHILHQLWDNLHIHYHATRRRVPKGLQELYADFARSHICQGASQHAESSQGHCQLANFRASIADGTLTDPYQIVREAHLHLNHARTRWNMLENIYSHNVARDIDLGSRSQATDDRNEAYQITWKTGLLYSINVIWMHKIILDQMQIAVNKNVRVDDEMSALFQKSGIELEAEALHVCNVAMTTLLQSSEDEKIPRRWSLDATASTKIAERTTWPDQSTSTFGQRILDGGLEIPGIPAIGVLVWPLYTAGCASRVANTRQLCARLLNQTSQEYLVPLAARAAECVESGMTIEEAGLAALGTF